MNVLAPGRIPGHKGAVLQTPDPAGSAVAMIRVVRRWPAIAVMATVVTSIGVFGLAAPPAMASSSCYFAEGGTWFAATCWTSTHPLIYESENYVVPAEPANTGRSTFALWGGLQDAAGDTVLQNVLNWNGHSWSAYPEYYWDGHTKHPHNMNWAAIPVYPGDTLKSTINSLSCNSAGRCTWALTIHDNNTDGNSNSTKIGSGVVFTMLLGGVFEDHTYSGGCASLPSGGHVAFSQIYAKDNLFFNGVSPHFGNSTPDHQCGMVIKSSPISTDFSWKG